MMKLVFVLVLAVGAAMANAKDEGAKFLAEVDQRPGVYKTASGLRFSILKKATDPEARSPNVDTTATVHYRGTLVNGKVFDSSYQRGEPIDFAPNQVIKGWTEALQYMAEGEKWEVYLPQELAYGSRGAGRDIPPFATLIFTIEILKVKGNGGKSIAEAHANLESALKGMKYVDMVERGE